MADQDERTKRRGAFSLQALLRVPHFLNPLLSPQCVSCAMTWKLGVCFSPGDETGFWEDDSNIVKHFVLSLLC